MILTGLATEQTFDRPEAQYYLVFNEGELRVPIAEAAARIVVVEMYGSSPAMEEQSEESDSVETFDTNQDAPDDDSVTDEDGIESV